jgi:hypothetical protein
MKVPAGIGANFIPMEFVKTSSARAELSARKGMIIIIVASKPGTRIDAIVFVLIIHLPVVAG